MTEVAYTNFHSKTKINGIISDSFTVMKDVRQGCQLSYCYILLWLRYLPFSLILIQGLKEHKKEAMKVKRKFY